MEIDMLRRLRVFTVVKNLPNNRWSTNIVSINQYEEIEELQIENVDESGMVTNIVRRRSPLATNPHISSTGPDLSQLLNDQVVPYARALGLRIAHEVDESLAKDWSLREPLFVTVDATFIKERRLIVPPRIVDPPSLLSRGASGEVLQRLVEEQRVEPADLEKEDETCSICIENLSESHENIIRMPDCLHMFHQDCLFEWLCRQNSCPLCRKVPYVRGGGRRRGRRRERGLVFREVSSYISIRFLEG